MNKIYYLSINKKNYISMFIILIGFITLFFMPEFISLLFLVVGVVLFDGPINRDLFVLKNNNLYFLTKNTKTYFRFIILIVLFISFALCISKYYFLSLLIFYIIMILLFINNFIIYKKNISYISNFDFDKFLDNSDYNIYKIKKVEKTSNYKIYTDDYSFNYIVNKGFIDYKELIEKIELYM